MIVNGFSFYFSFIIAVRDGHEEEDGEKEEKKKHENGETNVEEKEEEESVADALEHYRFIRLIRSQLLQVNPFLNVDETNQRVLKNKSFKRTFENLNHHYTHLMKILDDLSNDAKSITQTYRANV